MSADLILLAGVVARIAAHVVCSAGHGKAKCKDIAMDWNASEHLLRNVSSASKIDLAKLKFVINASSKAQTKCKQLTNIVTATRVVEIKSQKMECALFATPLPPRNNRRAHNVYTLARGIKCKDGGVAVIRFVTM